MSQAANTQLSTKDVDDLVSAHLPLVGHLVREVLSKVPAHVRRDDLFSAGSVALVAAAKTFDSSRGAPFSSYAAVRIRGALIDELRGLDWATRSVRVKARRVKSAQEEFLTAHGRPATSAELAAAMGVAASEVDSIEEDLQRSVILSLQGFAADGREDTFPEQRPSPEQMLLDRERIGYLHDAVDALPERLRAVIEGYFLRERPMAEIAEELGVTESRVSQLRAEALVLLRDGINAQLDPAQVAKHARPDGCAARRRAAYYAEVAAHGTIRSRLDRTTSTGIPVSLSA